MARMHRTQIHLGDEEIRALDRESAATGASRAELIRRAVRELYLDGTTADRRRPRSIGMGSSGRIGAVNAKEWIRREWDREHPLRGQSAG